MTPIHGNRLPGLTVLAFASRPARPLKTRKLLREHLERRCVLSVAPLPLEGEVPSLEAYVAAGHEMGPVALNASDDAPVADELNPAAVDAIVGEGADGSGSDAGETNPNEYVAEGEGSASGTGEEEEETPIVVDSPPEISDFSVEISDGQLLVHGRISDDGELTACSVSISGLVQSGLGVDEYGYFEWRTEIPLVADYIYAVASDGHNSSAMRDTFFNI